jgi:rubredoxin
MATKYYRLCCEICGFNLVTDGSNVKLTEFKRSKIQKEIPKLDPVTGKTAKQETKDSWIALPKKYKCPKCGRLISPRKFQESELENKSKITYDEDINTGGKGGFERF